MLPPHTLPLVGRGQASSHPNPLGAFGDSFLTLAMIRPPHFLNRGYAPEQAAATSNCGTMATQLSA